MSNSKMRLKKVIVNFDGASRGNPGPAALGGVIKNEKGEEIERFSSYIGEKTNNEAEYSSLIEAIKRAKRYKPNELVLESDSELLVKQLKNEYKVKSERLEPLYRKSVKLLKDFKKVIIKHISRDENKIADQLCNIALDNVMSKREKVKGKISATVRKKFDVAHRLDNYRGKCADLHGHTYFVEVTVSGNRLKGGILIDFVELKKIVDNTINQLDHKYLNELEEFKEISPTGENISIMLADKIDSKLPSHVSVRKIVIYESENAWIELER